MIVYARYGALNMELCRNKGTDALVLSALQQLVVLHPQQTYDIVDSFLKYAADARFDSRGEHSLTISSFMATTSTSKMEVWSVALNKTDSLLGYITFPFHDATLEQLRSIFEGFNITYNERETGDDEGADEDGDDDPSDEAEDADADQPANEQLVHAVGALLGVPKPVQGARTNVLVPVPKPRGYNTFAEMQQVFLQYDGGMLCKEELLGALQMTHVQAEAYIQWVNITPSVRDNIPLSAWDRWVDEETQRRHLAARDTKF